MQVFENPDSRIDEQITNRWRESWKRSPGGASANSRPKVLPCWAEPGRRARRMYERSGRDTSRRRRLVQPARPIEACQDQTHQNILAGKLDSLGGTYWFKKRKMYQGRKEGRWKCLGRHLAEKKKKKKSSGHHSGELRRQLCFSYTDWKVWPIRIVLRICLFPAYFLTIIL